MLGFCKDCVGGVVGEGDVESALGSSTPVVNASLLPAIMTPVPGVAGSSSSFHLQSLHQEADSLCPQLSSQGAEGQRGHSKQEHQEQ